MCIVKRAPHISLITVAMFIKEACMINLVVLYSLHCSSGSKALWVRSYGVKVSDIVTTLTQVIREFTGFLSFESGLVVLILTGFNLN